MTTKYCPEVYQDTVSNSAFVIQDKTKIRSDSTGKNDTLPGLTVTNTDSINSVVIYDSAGNRNDSTVLLNKNSVRFRLDKKIVSSLSAKESIINDSTSVCRRNPIADITYNNPDFVIKSIEQNPVNRFPFIFTEKCVKIQSDKRASVEQHLRSGQLLPQKLFHDDWVIGIVILAIVLFSLVQATSKSIMPGIARYFLFRGTKELGVRDFSGIFQWQSTILNLSSFFVIGLFAYFASSYFNIIPSGVSGFVVWLLSFGTVIAALTLRHFACVGTGILSGQSAVFQDYLHTVYQSYRYSAFFLFLLVILMAYTSFLPEKSYFVIGAFLLVSMYLIRIFRLFIIFINRNISIFYLILYLCALEILPVLISIKYFSGLA